jgi:hypothetical protein
MQQSLEDVEKMLHPLAFQAFVSVRKLPDGEIGLDKIDTKRLQRGLQALMNKPDLRDAVVSLVDVAHHCHKNGHFRACKELIAIANEATEPLMRAGIESARRGNELTEMKTRTFHAFTATDVQKAAPTAIRSKYGTAAPPGTFTAGNLASVKRRRA